MTGAMGDRVPPQTLTNEQEADLERLEGRALESISSVRPQDVYRDIALADWAPDLVPGVPLAIPDPRSVDYEGLDEHQKLAWSDLTSSIKAFLETHLDTDALKAQACGED